MMFLTLFLLPFLLSLPSVLSLPGWVVAPEIRQQHQAGPVVLQVAKDLDMADTVKAAQEGAAV